MTSAYWSISTPIYIAYSMHDIPAEEKKKKWIIADLLAVLRLFAEGRN